MVNKSNYMYKQKQKQRTTSECGATTNTVMYDNTHLCR